MATISGLTEGIATHAMQSKQAEAVDGVNVNLMKKAMSTEKALMDKLLSGLGIGANLNISA